MGLRRSMQAYPTVESHSDTSRTEPPSRDILVMEEERHRIARELHDGPLQTLTTMAVRLELCNRFSLHNDLVSLREELAELRRDFHASMRDLRDLMSTWRLPSLVDDSLREAIVCHVHEFAKLTGIEVSLELGDLPDGKLGREQGVAIFRILQEALRNSERHAGASHVWIEATADAANLQVSVRDNGRGFNVLGVAARYPRQGLGLAGMQERAGALGGELAIDSQPGRGTTIVLSVPSPEARHDLTCTRSPGGDHSGRGPSCLTSTAKDSSDRPTKGVRNGQEADSGR